HSRNRLKNKNSMLHYMAASLLYEGFMGYKAYTSTKSGFRFRVFLHDIENGELLSIMDANFMGMIRTGAVSAVAAKYISKKNSKTVLIFGSGFQAEGQLLGINEVRDIKKIYVYSRNEENRQSFCDKMKDSLICDLIPVNSPEEVIGNADIIITSTTSKVPVFNGDIIESGVHINSIGNNFLFKNEIDESTIKKCSIIAVEDIDQSKIEAGEFLPLIDKGSLHWSDLVELKDIVSGKINSRKGDDDITLFKSIGIAAEDIAVASYIYKIAKENKIGKNIDVLS
ncbi:MAG: ornithine cyclodeaminase family protein, partial [Thermodesulfobacteriota bacterium]